MKKNKCQSTHCSFIDKQKEIPADKHFEKFKKWKEKKERKVEDVQKTLKIKMKTQLREEIQGIKLLKMITGKSKKAK